MINKILDGRHFLIAEDHQTNQIVVTKMIEALGGTYDLASDGLEAIELFHPGKYDLALLDIEMPRKSGLEVIRHIRNDPNVASDFPILALTAFVLPNHKVQIREAGATAILAKPIVDLVDFGKSLSKYFDHKPVPSIQGEIDINANALDDLKNSLGKDIASDLVQNLDADLEKIHGSLAKLSKPVDKNAVRRDTHALLSLAGMAGADGLVEMTRNLNNECGNLSDEELINVSSDILIQIENLRSYLVIWSKG